MITITRNINFSNWFDVRLFGNLIDSTMGQASAMQIARRVKRQNKDKNLKIKHEK